MVNNYLQKVKFWILENKSDLYVAVLIFLVSIASFGLGRLSLLWPKKESIRVEQGSSYRGSTPVNVNENQILKTASVGSGSLTKGKYVASKNGTAYHFPWCAGALKIKEENKIWFETKEDATKAGYKPAGNCEGL